MNILIVTFLTGTSPSGVVTYYQTLARDLRAREAGVRVVETTDTPFVWNKLLNYMGHVFNRLGRVSRILWHEVSYFGRLYLGVRQHRHEAFDVIHAQDVRSGVAAYYALGGRVPVVLTAHFNDDPVAEWQTTGPLPGWLLQGLTRWYRWLFSKIANYVFVSDYAWQQSRHLLPPNAHRIILPNTVVINHNRNARISRPEAPNKFLIISNVGYVDARKNQELLIHIGQEIRQCGIVDFQIWLIGDGPKMADYTRLATNLGLEKYVRFWGRQAEPWRLVAQSDLYVHTALNDNCPYALLEAFAVQTPVLALPVGGIPELMPNGAGLLTGLDPARLTDQILEYWDADKRLTLSDLQTRFAQTNLSHEINFGRLWDFYTQAKSEQWQWKVGSEPRKQLPTATAHSSLLSPQRRTAHSSLLNKS